MGDALRRIAALLPDRWMVQDRARLTPEVVPVDANVDLVAPGGQRVSFIVEVKRSGTATSSSVLSTLRQLKSSGPLPVLFVSDYIGPSMREALTAENINYADTTGWVRIATDEPLIVLTGQGAARSPRVPGSTAVARFNGVAASRIIRELGSRPAPLGVRELALLADVSPGSVSKLLPTLASEGIIDRDERGAVVAVRRRSLIRRWVRDYSFTKSNASVGFFIAPRGIDRTLARLNQLPLPKTLTGSAAARRLLPATATPVVPLRLLAIYTSAPSALVDGLGLVDSDPVSANAIVGIPQDAGVLRDEIAPVALVLADLLTLPGRGDAEAEQLMDLLARTDGSWEA